MSANSHVTIWWLDQLTSYLGLIICTILCVITIKTIRSHDLPSRMRSLIYIVHILSILFFISSISTLTILPLLNALQIAVNQSTACYITYAALSTTGSLLLLSVVNLFFERLYLSFIGTDLELSPVFNVAFRVIVCTIWISLGFTYLFVSDPTPYNIYQQRIAIDSTDGVTCSTHAKGVDNAMTIIYELIAAMISITNLIIWALFISKLYTLLKQMTAANVTDVSAEFLVIMKHQTMLVGIAVFSSIILWTLEATLQIGQIFASIDFIVTVFACFLTFKFNEKYFIWFKCDVLTRLCCGWFERIISTRSITAVELKLAEATKHDAANKESTNCTVTTSSSGAGKSCMDTISDRDRVATLSAEQSNAATSQPSSLVSVSIDVIVHDA